MPHLEQLKDALSARRPKGFTAGTHRLHAPEETLAKLERHLSSMEITRLADVTGLDNIGIPVAVACRPLSRSLSVSQGKGLTIAAAKASALMESIELYHAERITLPIKYNSWAELAREHVLADVAALPKTAHRRFHPHKPMPWIEGWDLLGAARVWVPYEMVHTNYTIDSGLHPGVFSASSNGLASGNHLLEAISHGLCEVIERDATTLWYLMSDEARTARRVALDTVDDADCREVLARFEAAGVAAAVWDTTSDVGLPAFVCLIVDAVENPARPITAASGMGCHPARGIALLRALTEAAQSRLTVTTGSRDDVTRADQERHQLPASLAGARATVLGAKTPRSFGDAPTRETDDFRDDVAWELERLRAVGVRQAIAVNLTLPAFAIPVVRVVVPGLEGIHESDDYVPGARAQARGAEEAR